MRSKRHEDHESSERWLVSYADFITLLFAFFVVMYATSESNVDKQRKFQESLKQFLGLIAGVDRSDQRGGSDPNASKASSAGTGNQAIGFLHLPFQRREAVSELMESAEEFLQKRLSAAAQSGKTSLKISGSGHEVELIWTVLEPLPSNRHSTLAVLTRDPTFSVLVDFIRFIGLPTMMTMKGLGWEDAEELLLLRDLRNQLIDSGKFSPGMVLLMYGEQMTRTSYPQIILRFHVE